MKKYIVFLLLGCLVLLSAGAFAQSAPVLPSATKITYATNTVEVADSAAKLAVVVRKNNIRVQTRGTGNGATATIVDQFSGRSIWAGPVAKIRIVGLTAQTDSLKVISLKTTPFN